MTEPESVPKLLEWARTLQALAQSGLAYGEPSQWDRERYEHVRRIAAEMLTHPNGLGSGSIERLFAEQTGHATPKLDVRGIVFAGYRVLLVREASDGSWAPPGGWVDVGEAPSEAVEREVREESGYRTIARKLLALYDRDRHATTPHEWHIWQAFFQCDLIDDEPAPLGVETTDAAFFTLEDANDLVISRVTHGQLGRFFDHGRHPEWPTDFD